MSERNEIKAAMSPEEWINGEPGNDDPISPVLDPDGSLWLDCEDTHFHTDLDARMRHVYAAMCLHGQTFGFTWEDVDMLRAVVRDAFENEGHLLALANRLAALLPPREPEGGA